MFLSHDLATTQHIFSFLPVGSVTSFSASTMSSIVLLPGVVMMTRVSLNSVSPTCFACANLAAILRTTSVLPAPGGPQMFVHFFSLAAAHAAACVSVRGLSLASDSFHRGSRASSCLCVSVCLWSFFLPIITSRLY